jgi:hypothetical protein
VIGVVAEKSGLQAESRVNPTGSAAQAIQPTMCTETEIPDETER